MGRGLASILQAEQRETDGIVLRDLPISQIVPNSGQPRRVFSQDGLQALADSIAERGVLQPILVRPQADGKFEIVAGERRWRASALAEKTEIPALVQSQDDKTAMQAALIENMARIDLNPVEEARAIASLVEDMGMTQVQVGKMVGRSRVAISNLLRILDLPDEALDLVGDGKLSEGHARALLTADGHSERLQLAKSAVDQGWSVRVLEQKARAVSSAKPRPRSGGSSGHYVSSDHVSAARALQDKLESTLPSATRVKPEGKGFKLITQFDSLKQANEFLNQLGISPVSDEDLD